LLSLSFRDAPRGAGPESIYQPLLRPDGFRVQPCGCPGMTGEGSLLRRVSALFSKTNSFLQHRQGRGNYFGGRFLKIVPNR